MFQSMTINDTPGIDSEAWKNALTVHNIAAGLKQKEKGIFP